MGVWVEGASMVSGLEGWLVCGGSVAGASCGGEPGLSGGFEWRVGEGNGLERWNKKIIGEGKGLELWN